MADKETVVVRVESHEADARIIIGFLQSCGIEASISEDDAGDQLPPFEATHGVKIFVAAEDADHARRLLEERENAVDDTDDGDESD